MPKQGPPPPPNRSTPLEADELRETWNDRVSQGPPIGAMPEFDGWSMGAAMPLARSEHAVAELNGKIWVLGGYPPGRLPSDLVQVYDPATSRWSLGPAAAGANPSQRRRGRGRQALHDRRRDRGREHRQARNIRGRYLGPRPGPSGGWAQARADADRAPRAAARRDRRQDLRGRRQPAGGAPAFEGLPIQRPDTVGKASRSCRRSAITLPWWRSMERSSSPAAAPAGRDGGERVDVVEIYDPKYSPLDEGRPPLPAPRGGVTGAAHAGCMFVFGGEGERTHVLGLTPTTYAYDPRADRWTTLPNLPIAVHGLKGSAVIGGRIFLPGGGITLGGNSGTNAMQVYRPTMRCE
jgi:hypothetical protein